MSTLATRLLSRKPRLESGRLCVQFDDDSVILTHVVRRSEGLPMVTFYRRLPMAQKSPAGLQVLVKDQMLGRFGCSLLLNQQDYQLLLIEAPSVPQEELLTAVRWKIKDLLDFDAADAVLDVAEIPQDRDTGGGRRFLYVAAAPSLATHRLSRILVASRLQLDVIDIPEMAQRNVATELERNGEAIVFLAFDRTGGWLTFTKGGELYSSRRLDIGLDRLSRLAEFEFKDICQRLVLEVQRSLDYFDRQLHYLALSRFVIAPIPVDFGLQQALQDNLFVEVQSIRLDDVVDTSRILDLESPAEQALALHAIGCALREEA